jgi:putative transposase
MYYENDVTLDFSRPGKPTDNPFIESFNGSFRDECLNLDRPNLYSSDCPNIGDGVTARKLQLQPESEKGKLTVGEKCRSHGRRFIFHSGTQPSGR